MLLWSSMMLLLLRWTVAMLLLLSRLIVVLRLTITSSTGAVVEVDVPDIDNNTDNNCDYNLYHYHAICLFYSPQEISHAWSQVLTLVATDPIRLQLITTMFINTHTFVCGLCPMISVWCDDVQLHTGYQMSTVINDVL